MFDEIQQSQTFSALLESPELWSGFIGVLIGSLLTGLFNFFTVLSNNRNAETLKRLEIESDAALKKLELKHQKELKVVEVDSAKSQRFFEEKLKVFSEVSEHYSLIFQGGKREEIVKNCRQFMVSTAKIRIFVPKLKEELKALRREVVKLSVYHIKEQDEKDDLEEIKEKIRASGAKILDALAKELPKDI